MKPEPPPDWDNTLSGTDSPWFDLVFIAAWVVAIILGIIVIAARS